MNKVTDDSQDLCNHSIHADCKVCVGLPKSVVFIAACYDQAVG